MAQSRLAEVATAAPVPSQELDNEEIAWAAGVFEGEGSIVHRRNGTVLLTLGMTDRDVVERFQRAIRTGRLHCVPAGRSRRRKPLWRLDGNKSDDVLRVIDLLYPRLGTRRRQRADEVREALIARIAAATEPRICPNCHLEFTPAFTPNAKATKFCGRSCERRYHGRRRWGPRVTAGQENFDV